MKLINFYILENAPHKLVLGSDFGRKFKIELTFDNDKWHVNSKIPQANNSIIDSFELTQQEKNKAANVTRKFTSLCTGKLGRSTLFKHTIDTGDAPPVFDDPDHFPRQ